MKFKTDENMPVQAAEDLPQAGHDAMTVVDQNLGANHHEHPATRRAGDRLASHRAVGGASVDCGRRADTHSGRFDTRNTLMGIVRKNAFVA